MEERLHKALARAGVASRRAAERMIAEGRVRVNGQQVTELGTAFDPARDEVFVDGKRIRVSSEADQEKVYLLLHKPPGTLTTTRDDRGRKTVLDLVAGAGNTRIYPVGRLDYDAEGALLLTNDGALAHQLMHPKFHVPKTYMAKVKGRPKEESLERLRRGIYLEDGPTRAAHVEIIEEVQRNTWVEITITEGRNRLVKRMFWRIRHPVMKLLRTRFGNLTVDGLRPGDYRVLTKKELQGLKSMVR
ncbi:MAG: pseudouridine synthase [Myxococcota bacterium]